MVMFRWSNDQTNFLKEWWPHFGTGWVAAELGLSKFQVKSKADKLKLCILPKAERLCILCKINKQWDAGEHRKGIRCKECFTMIRKANRKRQSTARKDKDWPALFNEIARTLRYRNKKLHSSTYKISAEELSQIFNEQEGRCFYSGVKLEKPKGERKDYNAISVDRFDSDGAYTPDNIVLCTAGVNTAKMDMDAEYFINLCKLVTVNNLIKNRINV